MGERSRIEVVQSTLDKATISTKAKLKVILRKVEVQQIESGRVVI